MLSLTKSKRGATIDNFYALVAVVGTAITFLLLQHLWATLTTDAMDEAIWDQSSIGVSVKSNGQMVMNGIDMTFLLAYFGMHIGIIILAFLLRSHPVVYIAGIFLIVVLVLVSVPLSNYWEDIINEVEFADDVAQIPRTDYIMRMLPIFEVVWGCITLVALAALAYNERQ